MYNWLVFAWKEQTNELYLAGRAVLSLFDCADGEAADREKESTWKCCLGFQSELHLSIQTSALQNVIDLTATHICCPVLSVAIYFMLPRWLHDWKNLGKRKSETCSCSRRRGRRDMYLRLMLLTWKQTLIFSRAPIFFFLLSHSNTDIFCGAAKIETSSWRIKASEKLLEIHHVQNVRQVIQTGIC